jgi:transglutaminase-like putative cysteine protease
VQDSTLRIYAPVREGAFQQLGSLSASHTFQLTQDEAGNERMEFIFDHLPAYGSTTISITASVNLSADDNRPGAMPSERFLQDDTYLGLTHPGIQKVAKALRADNSRETAERIYNWLTKNIKKSGFVRRDTGASQTLESRSGDCTEFMYLFSALARANGIPTRNLAGFVARENRILRPADYHNWNEAFIDGEWHLVDANKQVFLEKSTEYIAMRLIEETSEQAMGSQGFFSSSADIRVSMN